MEPVRGDQASSYWVLGSGCAIERKVHGGDRDAISLRISLNVTVDLVEVRFNCGEDAGCRISGDVRVVDIHRPQNCLAGEAELQQFHDNCIPVRLTSCNRSAKTVLVVRAATRLLHKTIVSVCKVVSAYVPGHDLSA